MASSNDSGPNAEHKTARDKEMVILEDTAEPGPPEIKGVNTGSKVKLEEQIYKEVYDHAHDKMHDKPAKSDQLE